MLKKIRVLFVTPKLNLQSGGGSNYSLHLTASGLSQLGHEVKIIHLSDDAFGVTLDAPYQVLKANMKSASILQGRQHPTKMTCEVLNQYSNNADIFHLYGAFLALPGGIYKFFGGKVPVVVTLNNYELFCTQTTDIKDSCYKSCGLMKRLGAEPSFLKKAFHLPKYLLKYGRLGFYLANKVDQFLPVSEAVKQIYTDVGLNMHKSTIICDVIDYQSIQAHVTKVSLSKLNTTEWHILYIGRLAHEKGLDILVKALSLLELPAHLHIVGDGPQRDLLARQVKELHIENKVTFYGWVPNEKLWEYYKKAHLYIHPARWPEPCSRAVIEAMAFSLPVLVSNTGGSPWIGGGSGLTFRTGDADDLADKLKWCCLHYENALILAGNANKRASEFDYRRIVLELQEVYKKLVH